MDPKWKPVFDGFDKWLRFVCYLGAVWIFLDVIRFLPRELADRIVEAVLKKIGI